MARKSTRKKSNSAPSSDDSTETIKQGSVAEFFRKRTQLVGFDYGLNKHTQYVIEFLDNSLDAIESFQWKEGKRHPEYIFKLKDDLLLQNLSFHAGGVSEEDLANFEEKIEKEMVDDAGNPLTEDGNLILEEPTLDEEEELILETEIKKTDDSSSDDEEAKKLRKLRKKDEERAQEVQNILEGIYNYLFPIQPLVEREPFVIIQLTEREAQDVFADSSQTKKEVWEYDFEIFDNGTGMAPNDLEKFGRYLASSKSQKLRQTRGSQGFGSPSAFSDAQNTTGKPITVVSKNINHIYGIASQFYTTSKNNKEYVVPPTEIDCPFEHGTYVRLQYINVKYRKGFIDTYIQLTALTNPHITFVFQDPYGNEEIYPRQVSRFPREPTYALPHPSSINIGEFQDLLRSSTNLTLSAFLQDNFVRLSSSLAKDILIEAELGLEKEFNFINLSHGIITWAINKLEKILYVREEKRIFGRSKRPREKVVVYQIEKPEQLDQYWNIVSSINKISDQIKQKSKKIKRLQKKRNSLSVKKEITIIKKEIQALEKENVVDLRNVVKFKKDLSGIVKKFSFTPSDEINNVGITDKIEEKVSELLIAKSSPSVLTQKQTESLFKAFKGQKYMAPPSDPAVPIGASVLETTLIKEFKLASAFRTDLFLDFDQTITSLSEEKANLYSSRILYKFLKEPYYSENFTSSNLLLEEEELEEGAYTLLFQKFDALQSIEEDFVYGTTRPPTSGKGLAFVVEAAIAISPKISSAKKGQQVLMRYVNRTPKLRDNSDCAIWKGCQSVKWKNYKLDVFDNGIPKGNIKILVNVSGPYVHLMFKSQSKNALAEDEVLLKEIKFCLEAIGRKIRNFQNRKTKRDNLRKRSKVIEKYIPIFVTSLLNVVKNIPSMESPTAKELQDQMQARLDGNLEVPIEENKKLPQDNEVVAIKTKEEIEAELLRRKREAGIIPKETSIEDSIQKDLSSKSRPSKPKTASSQRLPLKRDNSLSKGPKPVQKVDEIIDRWKKSGKSSQNAKPVLKVRNTSSTSTTSQTTSQARSSRTPSIPKPTQSSSHTTSGTTQSRISTASTPLPKKLIKPESKIRIISTDMILKKIKDKKWLNLKDLIKLLEIKDIKDARYLQLKLKQLTREKKLLITINKGRTYWKFNTN
ncbi:MAG: DNA topoisomerase VI subunit B [Promethearchaeota archaeon]